MIYLILILTLITRFVFLDSTPPSLNWDEVSHGYNAFSILTSGKDEWGKIMPLIFKAYGDFKLPVYIYLTSVSEFFFGINSFAVRLPSVLSGIGTVWITYLLVVELLKDNLKFVKSYKRIALFSAFFVAIEPWTFFLGRPAFEANLALFLFILAVYLFIKFIKCLKLKYLIFSTLFFGLTVWTYNSYRIFTPLFLLSLLLIYKNELKSIFKENKILVKKTLILLVIFFVPMFYQLVSSSGSARYFKVAILDEGATNKIIESRRKIKAPDPIPRILSNKITYFSKEFIKNYFSHFSPKFLILEGGSNYQFSLPKTGLIYFINFPFLIIGFIYLLKLKTKESYLLLSWILLGPIASSLTREAPHVLRAITMLPIPMILTSFGVNYVIKKIKGRNRLLMTFLYVVILFLFFENYLMKYFIDYKNKYSESWQYGYLEVVSYIKENNDNYAKIIITKKYGEPHEFILFYSAFNSNRYRNDKNLNRFYQTGWYWVDGFDKYYFVNDWQIPKEGYKFIQESKKIVDCRQAKCLLVTSPKNAPVGWSKIKTVNFLDGSIAFELYENN
jgi:4-amino-4-deoxy-L-arabinose transferase-like glycosyltransferase